MAMQAGIETSGASLPRNLLVKTPYRASLDRCLLPAALRLHDSLLPLGGSCVHSDDVLEKGKAQFPVLTGSASL